MKRADDAIDQQLEWDDMEEWDDVADSDVAKSPTSSDSDKPVTAADTTPSSSSTSEALAVEKHTKPETESSKSTVPEPEKNREDTSESNTTTDDERLSSCPKVDVSEESSAAKSGESSPEMLPSPSQVPETLKVKDKGDMVYVGSDRNTPSSDSTNKESSSLDDDWEKEFDLEVTEEDLRLAQEAAKMLKEKGVIADGDDEENEWENWD